MKVQQRERRHTTKVIIIRSHAAPHLADGDNLSQHFQLKGGYKQTDGMTRHTHPLAWK